MEKADFRVGNALGQGFGIWFRNFPAFMVLAILVYAPLIAYTAFVASGTLTEQSQELSTFRMVSGLVQLPLNILVGAAVLYGAIQQMCGRPARILASIGVGLRRLLPVLGVGLLSGLAVGVWLLVAFLPGGDMFLPLALVPCLVLACMFYVAVPAAVIERPGLLGALRRSRQLTDGYKTRVLGVVLVLGILTLLVAQLLLGLFEEGLMSDHQIKVSMWLGLAADIALASLNAAVNAVVYRDLRGARDGTTAKDLARVFE